MWAQLAAERTVRSASKIADLPNTPTTNGNGIIGEEVLSETDYILLLTEVNQALHVGAVRG
jgi:hypothetical protein